MTREVLVIGGGPAGVEAAVEAARAGCGVTLASETPPGGRASAASLLPSKVLLRAAAERRARGSTGLASDDEMARVSEAIAELSARWSERQARRLEDAGVRVVRAVARFTGAGSAELAREGREPESARWDAAVVASGSVPVFPEGLLEGPMPDGQRVLAPRALRAMRTLPRTIAVVGGGATGAEMAHAFAAMGVEVTWLLDEYGILPGIDRELSDSLGDVLMERGVKIVHGKRVLSLRAGAEGVVAALEGGRSYTTERAFVAVGRRPDLARLGLETLGISADAKTGGLAVDAKGMSAAADVYAAGDALGGPLVAGKAIAEGRRAGRAAAGLRVEEGETVFVEAIYTQPEIALVGLTPQRARSARRDVEVRTAQYPESLGGVLARYEEDKHARGTLRVVLDPERGVLLGATAIGAHAAELLAPIAVAIRCGARASELASLGLATPTLSELVGIACA